ncbi:hypothetical protein [Arabidopsis thaliana]|uniref:Uncharacterized protein T12O21.6 n=1 Tax=Arabidopsis thaliana TaxID=3702 RepID=Q9C6X1_ARATH|nr:hypothetical protein [Arabidopsis thaliana]
MALDDSSIPEDLLGKSLSRYRIMPSISLNLVLTISFGPKRNCLSEVFRGDASNKIDPSVNVGSKEERGRREETCRDRRGSLGGYSEGVASETIPMPEWSAGVVNPTLPAVLDGTEANENRLVLDATAHAEGIQPIAALPPRGQMKALEKRQRSTDPEAKSKKKKKKASREEGEPIYVDKIASANLIASCGGRILPPPEKLLESEQYAEASSFFLRAFSSMNKMVRSYDSTTRACLGANEKLAEAEKKLAAEGHARAEAESKEVEATLAKEKAKEEWLEAIRNSRRETSATFADKFQATEAKMLLFYQAYDRYMLLVQAKANDELITALEGGGALAKEKKQYGDTEAAYTKFAEEIKKKLMIPLVSPVSIPYSLGVRSSEVLSDKVGVVNQAGSNLRDKTRHSEDEPAQ